MDIQSHLQRIANMFNVVMKDKLVGTYVHGSLAMGCFNPNKSDIDLLVVVSNKLTKAEKKQIAKQVLLFRDELPSGNGIELSIVLESFIKTLFIRLLLNFTFLIFIEKGIKLTKIIFVKALKILT